MPLAGENPVRVGAGMKVKELSLVAVPPGVVTLIVPVAPLPTVALMVLSLAMVKAVAAVPPKATAVAQVKPEPLMVTDVPVRPLLGVNAVRVGAGMKVKVPRWWPCRREWSR